jgi:hypothetical protein
MPLYDPGAGGALKKMTNVIFFFDFSYKFVNRKRRLAKPKKSIEIEQVFRVFLLMNKDALRR